MSTSTIAEIGINFAYGNDKSRFVENAKKLIDAASVAGFNFVKFQKRNPDTCVPDEQKLKTKNVPWINNKTTYLQYKKDIELDFKQYIELTKYAISKSMELFVSVWDIDSIDFAVNVWYETHKNDKHNQPILKIPSALITNIELLKYARIKAGILMISTGMSTEKEIEAAISIGCPDIIFHTNSSYPSNTYDLNLSYIQYLAKKWPNLIIGYSGHEYGLTTTFAAVAMGATIIERHVTLNRTLWGSDQMASIEPIGQIKLIKGIKDIELSIGYGGPRIVSECEYDKRKSLRGI